MQTIDFATMNTIMPLLQRHFGESLAEDCNAKILEAVNLKWPEADWNNTKICFNDGKKSFSVVSGTGSHNMFLYIEDGIVDIVKLVRTQYLDEIVSVKVINKRVLGKLIIQCVGNEGAEVDARKCSLRKLLQATIDYIQNHNVPGIWENATVIVYDLEDNTFKIESGNGKNNFIVTEKKGEPTITYTVKNKVKELKDTKALSITNDAGILLRIGHVGRRLFRHMWESSA